MLQRNKEKSAFAWYRPIIRNLLILVVFLSNAPIQAQDRIELIRPEKIQNRIQIDASSFVQKQTAEGQIAEKRFESRNLESPAMIRYRTESDPPDIIEKKENVQSGEIPDKKDIDGSIAENLVESGNSPSAAAGVQGWTTIMTEDFEGAWPSAGWITASNYILSNGAEITWKPWAYHPAGGMKSCYCQGTVVDPSSQKTYSANPGTPIQSVMRYGPFSLAEASDAQMIFKVSYQLAVGDKIMWGASSDPENVQLTGYFNKSNWGNYETITYDLKTVQNTGNLCGQPEVYIWFYYEADAIQSDNKGAFIDDISLQSSQASGPNMSLDLAAWSAPSAGGASSAVHVTSSGAAISYTVSSSAGWLTTSASSGTTPGSFIMNATANNTPSTRTATVTVAATSPAGTTGSPVTVNVTQPIPNSDWTTIMTEGFEGTWPSNGWTLSTNLTTQDGPVTWDAETYHPCSGSKSGFPHGSVLDPSKTWSVTATAGNKIESDMRYGPFSLAEATDAQFTFKLSCQLGAGDEIKWGVSAGDPGTSVQVLTARRGTSNWPNWETVTFSLKDVNYYGNLCGQPEVYIHFTYIADDVQDNNEAAFIDDISLQVLRSAIQMSVDMTAWDAPAAGGASSAVHVTGSGAPISYMVSDNANWLTTSASSGTTPGIYTMTATANNPGSPRTATVTVTANSPAGTTGSPATITVTQGVPLPQMSVDLTSWPAPNGGGTSSAVHVTSSGGAISYTVSDNAAWLTTSASTGTTPGSFTMNATANATASTRTATVTVTATSPAGTTGSPATIQVTQPSPTSALSIRRTTVPIIADGVVESAWADAAPVPMGIYVDFSGQAAVQNQTDIFAEFRMLWDNNYMYLLVTIRDDSRGIVNQDWWSNDALELFFDADYSRSATYDGDDVQIAFRRDIPGYYIPAGGSLREPSTVYYGLADRSNGWTTEIAVNLYGLRIPATIGHHFGFEIQVDDNDSGVRDQMLKWFNAEDNSWQNPRLFGEAVLEGTTDVADREHSPVASSCMLYQNYPNPFNPTTEIRYFLPNVGDVELRVYDEFGRQAATLAEGYRQAGDHVVTFDAKGLPSGLYTYRLKAGNSVITKKLLLLR
jgi:hypothetical protein